MTSSAPQGSLGAAYPRMSNWEGGVELFSGKNKAQAESVAGSGGQEFGIKVKLPRKSR